MTDESKKWITFIVFAVLSGIGVAIMTAGGFSFFGAIIYATGLLFLTFYGRYAERSDIRKGMSPMVFRDNE